MSYTAPTVSSTGITIPTYSDILAYYVSEAETIFGSDIYLGTDSADYQLLSIIARMAYDSMSLAQLAYNSMRATTAIGTQQDSLYKINGISRKSASYSTCDVTITGTAGTIITNGKVQDTAGYYWDLPTTTTIGSGGTVTETATCETIGAITAAIGNLTIIATPTAGWTSVTNASAAVEGTDQETDSAFRARQTTSTELPSQTILAGTIAAIAATEGVTRYKVVENPTNAADSDGTPAHSITPVVEGGTIANVAQSIYDNRGLGCYMNGDVEYVISDSTYGTETTVRFYRPSYVPIYATINVKELTGYTTSTTTSIQTAIVSYLNNLQIGEELTISGLYAAAMAVNTSIYKPTFSITSITAGISSGSQSSSDISVTFNEVVEGLTANITVNAS